MLNILEQKIRIAGIIEDSIVDGPGFRVVIFFQGCKKRCFGCHNQDTLPLNGGYLLSIQEIRLKWIKNPLCSGITISGGEPFLQAKAAYYLSKIAHIDGLNVIVYSGYYLEELLGFKDSYVKKTLEEADFLIEGPFEFKKKSHELYCRGSSNQRIINLKESHFLGKLTFSHNQDEMKFLKYKKL